MSFPVLQRTIAQYALGSLSERRGDGGRAIINHHAKRAPFRLEAYDSLSLRFEEYTTLILNDAGFFPDLAES
eukprot:12435770-Alexandrium_andersonii.AAC.1